MRVVPRNDVLSQAVLLSGEGGGEPKEDKVDNQTGSEDCGEQNLQGVRSLLAVLLEGAGDSDEHDAGCSPGRRGVMQSLQDGGSLRVDLLEGEGNSEGQGGGSPQVVLLAGEGDVRNVMQSRVSWVEAVSRGDYAYKNLVSPTSTDPIVQF